MYPPKRKSLSKDSDVRENMEKGTAGFERTCQRPEKTRSQRNNQGQLMNCFNEPGLHPRNWSRDDKRFPGKTHPPGLQKGEEEQRGCLKGAEYESDRVPLRDTVAWDGLTGMAGSRWITETLKKEGERKDRVRWLPGRDKTKKRKRYDLGCDIG